MSLIGAGIQAVGGIIQSGIQANSTKQANKRNEEYNTRQWWAQNLYNHPTMQRARLEEAGLNPALMYGNGGASTGNASSPASLSADTPDYSALNKLSDAGASYINLKKTNADTANAQKEIEVKDSSIALQNSATSKNLSETATTDQQRLYAQDLHDTAVQQASATLKSTGVQTAKTQQEVDNTNQLFPISKTAKELENTNLNLRNQGLISENTIKEINAKFHNNIVSAEVAKVTNELIQQMANLDSTMADVRIKRYEAFLNKRGLTKSDPLHYRLIRLAQNAQRKGYNNSSLKNLTKTRSKE